MQNSKQLDLLSPQQIYEETRDFLKSKRDDNLDDLAHLISACRSAIGQLDTGIAAQLNKKSTRGISAEDRVIARTRVSQLRRQRALLVNARKQLRSRLRSFSSKQILSDKLDQIKADSKDPAKRAVWKKALEKNLRKFPRDTLQNARSAKSDITKEKYLRVSNDLAEVASISDPDLQRDAAERFLKDHNPEWHSKLSGDAEYKQQMLTVFLNAVTAQQFTTNEEENGGRDEAV
ncbi:MAG: hypothetical protein WC824_06220 [Bacteroidota bacterium]|jgi:hypothetical protein